MRYIALIYSTESQEAPDGSPEQAETLAGYVAFAEEAVRRGALQGGHRLRPIVEARTVRVKDGNAMTVNGPFAETREQLGGFYVLECQTEAEAVELAAKIPHARMGSVEVRPVWEM